MLPLETILLFLAADIALKLSPGPDAALVLTRSVAQGARPAIASAAGVAAAGLIQIPAVMLGLASIVTASPALFGAIKLAGAFYLLWLGFRAIRRSLTSNAAADLTRHRLSRTAFRQGLITNLLNPKVTVFLVAFLPQFTDPNASALWWQVLFFGTWMKMNGFLMLSSLGLLAARARSLLLRNPSFIRWQEGALGVGLLGLGAWLLADAWA